MMPKNTVEISRDARLQADHYAINLWLPWEELHRENIRTPEEFHGYVIAEVEALLAKGCQ